MVCYEVLFVLMQKSLLALEWLLMTDLIAPDHIAVICSRTLISLYTSDSADQALLQKARKVQP